MASGAVGMNAARISRPLAGRWVKTIVRTRPMRRAMRTATSAENADSTPAQKNTAPLTASDRPKRFCSHSTTSGGDHEAAAEGVEAEQRGQPVDDRPRRAEGDVRRVGRRLDGGGQPPVAQQHDQAEHARSRRTPSAARSSVDAPTRAPIHSGTPAHSAPTAATSVPIRL